MKTKLTLLVAILAAKLFLGGCASATGDTSTVSKVENVDYDQIPGTYRLVLHFPGFDQELKTMGTLKLKSDGVLEQKTRLDRSPELGKWEFNGQDLKLSLRPQKNIHEKVVSYGWNDTLYRKQHLLRSKEGGKGVNRYVSLSGVYLVKKPIPDGVAKKSLQGTYLVKIKLGGADAEILENGPELTLGPNNKAHLKIVGRESKAIRWYTKGDRLRIALESLRSNAIQITGAAVLPSPRIVKGELGFRPVKGSLLYENYNVEGWALMGRYHIDEQAILPTAEAISLLKIRDYPSASPSLLKSQKIVKQIKEQTTWECLLDENEELMALVSSGSDFESFVPLLSDIPSLRKIKFTSRNITPLRLIKIQKALPQCLIEGVKMPQKPERDPLVIALEGNNQDFLIALKAIAPSVDGAGNPDFQVNKSGHPDRFVYRKHNLTDRGIARLKELKSLRTLGVNGSLFVTDACAGVIGQMHGLESLDLTKTQITDKGLDIITKNLKLFTLGINETDISDGGLAIIGVNMPGIHHLGVARTGITEAGVKNLSVLKELRTLNLSGCNLKDSDLSSLTKLNMLKSLWLDGVTEITDKSVTIFTQIKSLENLGLRESGVTPEGIELIRKALPKCKIYENSKETQNKKYQSFARAFRYSKNPTLEDALKVAMGDKVEAVKLLEEARLNQLKHSKGKLIDALEISGGDMASAMKLANIALEPDPTTVAPGKRRVLDLKRKKSSGGDWSDISDACLKRLAEESWGVDIVGIEIDSRRITDEGLKHLSQFESLESLEIPNSPNITRDGLKYILQCEKLSQISGIWNGLIRDDSQQKTDKYLWFYKAIKKRASQSIYEVNRIEKLSSEQAQAEQNLEGLNQGTYAFKLIRSIQESGENAIAGDMEAQIKLGVTVLNIWWSNRGFKFPDSHVRQIAEWMKSGAQKGHPKALNVMSALYQHGIGVKPNRVDAYMFRILATKADSLNSPMKLSIFPVNLNQSEKGNAEKLAAEFEKKHLK